MKRRSNMRLTRRDYLRMGLGSSAALACGNVIPGFLADSALAFAEKIRAGPGHILVVVELDGGNDGLNTIVPYGDDIYYRNRPRLQVPAKSVLKIDDHIGLHPRLRSFVELLDREQLGIIQSV